MCHCISCLILFILAPISLRAQIVWQQKPQDYQLFPRNESNTSIVTFEGQVLNSAVDSLILLVHSSDGEIDTVVKKMSGQDSSKQFNFQVEIKAGLIEYQFMILRKYGQETDTIMTISHVCCGDVIFITGQSNALAIVEKHPEEKYPSNQFVRSFGKPFGDKTSDFDKDSTWGLGNALFDESNTHAYIGFWGYHVADSLVKKFGIPICILNGAEGGTKISQHQKNKLNPKDWQNIYNRLLFRAEKSKLQSYAKAIIWYQGESEGDIDPLYYTNQFEQLYQTWLQDYLQVKKVYVFQIHHGCGSLKTSMLREEQRNLFKLDPGHIQILSTMNIETDGCHYDSIGYKKLSDRLFPLIAHDLYRMTIKPNDFAPNILQAVYVQPNTLALVFDQPILMDTMYKQFMLKDYFFNEQGGKRLVKNLRVHQDTLLLDLYFDYAFKKISYTPDYGYHQNTLNYEGPYIYNDKGNGAFTFYEFPTSGYVEKGLIQQTLFVFPNPSKAGNNLNIHSMYDYRIYDISGRLMNDLNLLPGIYFIRSTMNQSQKIIIQ